MIITSKAPARIDLAGGTLDLWPLYLFFDNPGTINCAIDQYAETKIEAGYPKATSGRPEIELESLDKNCTHKFESYGELVESFASTHKAIKLPPNLWLHAKVVRHFFSLWRKAASLKVSTQCASPAGAGLGGSSALNISLCAGLRQLTLANYNDDELLALARDLESTVIEGPAGVQDYWSALFGGIQLIRLDVARLHRKVFYKQKDFIESQVILCYSGQSRNSGINNWSVYKNFIDKDPKVKQAFDQIVKATHRVEESLERQSFELFSQGISEEWAARKLLAPGIATEGMLKSIAAAEAAGSTAAKVCGAGGGGCFIVITPQQKRNQVIEALKSSGATIIDFKVVEEGCTVSST